MSSEDDLKMQALRIWLDANLDCLLMDAYVAFRDARAARGGRELSQNECFEAASQLFNGVHRKFHYQLVNGAFDLLEVDGQHELARTMSRAQAYANTNVGGAVNVMHERVLADIGKKLGKEAELAAVNAVFDFEKASLSFLQSQMAARNAAKKG